MLLRDAPVELTYSTFSVADTVLFSKSKDKSKLYSLKFALARLSSFFLHPQKKIKGTKHKKIKIKNFFISKFMSKINLLL